MSTEIYNGVRQSLRGLLHGLRENYEAAAISKVGVALKSVSSRASYVGETATGVEVEAVASKRGDC